MANTEEIKRSIEGDSRISTIREVINTPQIIFGRNNLDIFSELEDMRDPLKENQSVTSWYDKAISPDYKAIFLSTIENSDILEFSYNINAGGASREQGQFVIKILDPTNTFEDRFLSFFSIGSKSYSEWLSTNYINRSISRKKPGLMITFGETDDPKKWAPVQSCELIYINYELDDNNVRTFTLTLAPSLGIAALDVTPDEEDNLTGNVNKSYAIERVFIDSTYTDELVVREDPTSLVLNIIKDTYAAAGELPTFLITQKSIVEALNRLWTAAAINANKNYIANIKKAVVPAGKKKVEGYDELLEKLIGSMNKGGISPDNQGFSVDLKGGFARRDAPLLMGDAIDNSDLNEFNAEAGWRQGDWEERDQEEREAMSEAALGKTTDSHWFTDIGKTVLAGTKISSGFVTSVIKAPFAYGANKIFDADWDYSTGLLESGVEDISRTAKDVAKKVGKSAFEDKMQSNSINEKTQGEVFKDKTGIELSEAVEVTGIKIDKIELYIIYLQTAYEFFQNLDLRVLEDFRDSKGNNLMGGGLSSGGDEGKDPRKLIEDAVNDVYIRLVAPSKQALRNEALSILSKINSGESFITQVFSDIGLCKEVYANLPNNMKPSLEGGKFDKFVLISTGEAYSHVAGLEKKENKFESSNEVLYKALKEAFAAYRKTIVPEVIEGEEMHSFTYGYINSDILSFNFDLHPWYAFLISNVIPTIATNGLLGRNATEHNLLKSLSDYYENNKNLNDGQVRGIISEWYDLHEKNPNSDLGKGFVKISLIYSKQSYIKKPREYFINRMVEYFTRNFKNLPKNPQHQIVDPIQKSSALKNILAIRDRVSQLTFSGEIETLPYYKFISPTSLMTKVNINFKEPQIKTNDFRGKGPPSTWLSGIWLIQGLGFTVSQGRVSTSFNIVKPKIEEK